MGALNVFIRGGRRLAFRGSRPTVTLGLPVAGPTAKSSSDTFTLTEGTATVFPFSAISSSDSAVLSQTSSVSAGPSTSDSFSLVDSASSSLTFVNVGSGANGFTVNIPTGVIADDIIIAHLFLWSATGATPVNPPDGTWTVEDDIGGGGGRNVIAWKRAGGTEGGTTVTFTLGAGSASCRNRAAVYRGIDWSTGPFDGSAAFGEENPYTGDNPQPGPVSISLAQELVLVFDFAFGAFLGSAGGFTASDASAQQRYDDYTTSGFTGIKIQLVDEPFGSGASQHMSGSWHDININGSHSMGWLARVLKAVTGGATLEISVTSSDSFTLSSTSSVVSSGTTPVSDSDSGALTDSAITANPTDVEILHFSDSGSVVVTSITTKSDSDSATLTDSGAVTVPALPTSSDSVALSETNIVVVLTDTVVNSSDSASLTEAWTLVATLSPTDTFTFTETSANITSKPSQCYIRSRY